MVKTRFAPSPTGMIHIGNMRTALFNALMARHSQGIFLLRIEDTDAERSKDEHIEHLCEDLKWLGLDWQEGIEVEGEFGPYRQSDRQATYDHYYQALIDQKMAYPCFCTDEQLKLSRKLQQAAGQPPRYDGRCARLSEEEVQQKLEKGQLATLRFRIPLDEEVSFVDLVQGPKTFKTNDIGDFIIRRTSGMPSFMFCNAIDDALMKVTHAMRGEDHLTNTPRQLLILKTLGLNAPEYAHFSLINGSDGSPLSKRNGSQSIQDMRKQGYFPEAVLNYLGRLGHYYENTGFLSLEELAEQFNTTQLSRSPARFDVNQLMYWQSEAFKTKTVDEIWAWMRETVEAKVPKAKQKDFATLIAPNVMLLNDAEEWADRAFGADVLALLPDLNEQALSLCTPEFFDAAIEAVKAHGLDYAAWLEFLKGKGFKGKALFQPLRLALMGHLHGPEMDRWVALLGNEDVVVKRLSDAKERITKIKHAENL